MYNLILYNVLFLKSNICVYELKLLSNPGFNHILNLSFINSANDTNSFLFISVNLFIFILTLFDNKL